MKKILKTFNLYCLSFLFLAAMNACQNDDVAFPDEEEASGSMPLGVF